MTRTTGKAAAAAKPTQENTTIVLDGEALADTAKAHADGPRVTVEATAVATPVAAPVTAPLSKEVASQVSASTGADEANLGATKPRLAAVPPPAPAAPSLETSDPGATTQLPMPAAEFAPRAEIMDEVDMEWTLADQPTLQMVPRPPNPARPLRPAYLETGEQPVWPPRPTPPSNPVVRPGDPSPTPLLSEDRTPTPIPRPATLRTAIRPPSTTGRLPSPTGRQPVVSSPAAYSNPRLRRFQELREQREAHTAGKHAPGDMPPVAQMVRQWWSDLLPGLQTALQYQHAARASGVYPIPAHEPTVAARLGDAFGRLTAAVRDLSERAQSAAGPKLNRLHDRAEHAAQVLVNRIEGPPERQQAPLLGPGRLAVFFRPGVTMRDAQQLLLTSRARPLRLIPRRHGFLALVPPGRESEVGGQLRVHPFVRDVVYLEYDEGGHPAPTS
jgi:hypothetical protein